MSLSRRTRYFTTWIACIAVLLSALAPAVARVLAATNTPFGLSAEMCSTNKAVLSASPADDRANRSPLPSDHTLHLDHCPYCQTHAGSFGLVPVAASALVASGHPAVFPPLFYRSP